MITIGDAGKDTLGDLLKQPSGEPGYNPRQWQDEANGKEKNRVLVHGSGSDVAELVEPLPDVPRVIEIPEALPARAAAIEKFRKENPDLEPHYDEGCQEITRLLEQHPNASKSDIFNLAVYRICKNHNLPLARPASLPAPLEAPTVVDEIRRLEAERDRAKNPPRQWATSSRGMDVVTLRSMPPAAKVKARR